VKYIQYNKKNLTITILWIGVYTMGSLEREVKASGQLNIILH